MGILDRDFIRKRNTFQHKGFDIIVEADSESVSGISFNIHDKDIDLQNAYCTFAYFDDLDRFIDCGRDWDIYLGKA